MERKKRPPPANRPAAEHKPPPAGNNLIWYFAGLAVVTLVLVNMFGHRIPGEDPLMAS